MIGFRVARVILCSAACLIAFSGNGFVHAGEVPHPSRVVTLAPSLAELAAAFLGPDLSRIVGVSEYTDFPGQLKAVVSIGPYHHFNIEKVVALKPDLVLATTDGNAPDQVQHLRELKLNVLVIESSSFEQIEASMRTVGTALGDSGAGLKMAAEFHAGLVKTRERGLKHRPALKRVLLQLGEDPIVVVGQNSFLDDVLQGVGAENIYGGLPSRYPRPSLEDVAARNPDLILVLSLGGDDAVFERMAQNWKRLPSLRAVRSGSVRVLRADTLLRPSLRLLEGLSILEKAVYGAG